MKSKILCLALAFVLVLSGCASPEYDNDTPSEFYNSSGTIQA